VGVERALRHHFHRVGRGDVPARKRVVVPTPEWELTKYLFIYPMKLEDDYYLTLSDYFNNFIATTKEVANRRGWDYVVQLAQYARRHAFIKDTPLLVAQLVPDARSAVEILKLDYPIAKYAAYIDIARKARVGGGYSRRKKRAVTQALYEMPYDWHEYQAIKYPRKYRRVLRYTHPKPTETLGPLWSWLMRKGPAPTERVRAAERLSATTSTTEIIRLMTRYRLPIDLLRSGRAGKPFKAVLADTGAVSHGEFIEWARATFTPRAALSLAVPVLRSLPPTYARAWSEFVESIFNRAPIDALSRFAVNMVTLGETTLAAAAIETLERRGEEVMREAGLFGGDWRDIVVLLDLSGSMNGNPIRSALAILLAMSKMVSNLYGFHWVWDKKKVVEIELPLTVQSVRELIDMTGGGTPLLDAVRVVADAHPDKPIIVLTDEQENVSHSNDPVIAGREAPILFINVAAYPAEYVVKKWPVAAGAGRDINAVIASLRAVDIFRIQQTDRVVDPLALVRRVETQTPLLE